jgi:hypothetical protein
MQSIKLPYPHLTMDQPAAYRITVQGWVSVPWEDWFGGLSVSHVESTQNAQPNSTPPSMPVEMTILTGLVEDQAALLGTLQRLYAFGLPLLSLELVSSGTDACGDDLNVDIPT